MLVIRERTSSVLRVLGPPKKGVSYIKDKSTKVWGFFVFFPILPLHVMSFCLVAAEVDTRVPQTKLFAWGNWYFLSGDCITSQGHATVTLLKELVAIDCHT